MIPDVDGVVALVPGGVGGNGISFPGKVTGQPGGVILCSGQKVAGPVSLL